MKYVDGILSYLVFAYVVTLMIEQSTSKVRNSLSINETEINNADEDDDFVPYQGERFSSFDWLLFKTVSKEYSGNVLLSPISLKIALILLYEGAQDETAHELAGAMQLPGTRTATRDKFSSILESFQSNSPAYTLNIGTRIYIDSNIFPSQRYKAIVKTFYNTEVITANLSDTQLLVQDINNWVSNITDGNIDQMIKDDTNVKNSLMLIMNTLFFKGLWRHKYFSSKDTKIGKFYTIDNQTIDVPFMHVFGRFYYSESSELNAKILRIPYDGHKFALYLLLPRTLDGIERVINKVNPFMLARHVWLMQDLPIDVSIPKFKFEFSSHLEPILRELGIRDIFDDTATLTGIAKSKRISRRLKVSDILQKAGIEVNENGTAAYVATEIEIVNKIGDETFNANHPFLFYIEDESTGTITYIGKMMNPLNTTDSDVNVNSSQHLPSNVNQGVPEADSIFQAGLNAESRNNLFNVYFSQALSKEYKIGNLISSPASVTIILSMLMEGTNGDTKSEIASVLRLPKNESQRKELMQRILASLKRNENGTEVDLATRLWVHENLRVLDNYKDILRSFYQGDIESVNFIESQSSAHRINKWIHRVTRNVISPTSLLNDLSPDTRLILTSVIYFKGRWLKSFDKTSTKLQCFYIPSGKCRNMYFMKHESVYRYAYISSIDAHVLEIPYSDGKTSMLTFMPSSRENDPYLRILSEDLITVSVSAILASLEKRAVTIHLPKFNIEKKLNLVPTLQNLGIENIFGLNTNFTKMISNGSVRVANIFQNVKIEIDEEGTLAAADTEIGYTLLAAWKNDIKMDRPFLFIIIDSILNMTLFSGRFIEPIT